MNKSNISLVLAALLATSGFAMAQTTPAMSASGDAKTRAEVKAGINAPNSQPGSPTQDARARSEAGVPSTPSAPSGTTRADVKASINTPNAPAGSPTQNAQSRSEASVPSTPGTSHTTRAEVKADTATAKKTAKMTREERRARNAERRAAGKTTTPDIATSKEAGGASSTVNAK
ncbi:MAG: hypothetical protein H0W47_10025 [Polaromonas sp.]|uniref:hypothetical protein n=1 Tax=Polaromonas sp. TaxID=1869339 RepID=UPI001795E2CD|nr:hypothetical protein [Polaromonas sp.]MBA3594120.1 hypothetical protein [Polaromonas sp.]